MKKLLIMPLIGSMLALTACGSATNDTPTAESVYVSENEESSVEETSEEASVDFSNPNEAWAYFEENYPSVTCDEIESGSYTGQYVIVESVAKDVEIDDLTEMVSCTMLYPKSDGTYTEEKVWLCFYTDEDLAKMHFLSGKEDLMNMTNGARYRGVYLVNNDKSFGASNMIAFQKIGDADEAAVEEAKAEESSVVEDSAVDDKDSAITDISTYINHHVRETYSGTYVDDISINEDLGTDADGDYVALVYLTWNVKNGADLSEEVLDMYSDDLAASLAEDQPNVQEVAIFWKVPYLTENTSKWSYERKSGGMYRTDKMLGW